MDSCNNKIRIMAMVLLLSILWQQVSAQEIPAAPIPYTEQRKQLRHLLDADLKMNGAGKLKNLYYILEKSRKIGYHYGYIEALNRLGTYHSQSGETKLAIWYTRKAISYVGQTMFAKKHLALLYNNLALYENIAGNYDSAVVHCLKAIEYQERYATFFSEAGPYVNLSNTYISLGRYKQALLYSRKAYEIIRKELEQDSLSKLQHITNRRVLSAIHLNIGISYHNMPHTEKDALYQSESYLKLALSDAIEHGFPDIEHVSLRELGNLYRTQGKPETAIGYYRHATGIIVEDAFEELLTAINMGACYYDLKQYEAASEVLESASKNIKARNIGLLPDVYKYLAKTYHARGLFKKSSYYYDRYIELYDQFKGGPVQEKVNRIQESYEQAQKNNELIRKELQITRQKSVIQKKNMQTYGLLSGVAVLAFVSVVFVRSRHRTQKQKAEIAAWRASLEGEEKERSRLARALHDSIGGSLSTVKMWFDTIQRRYKPLTEAADYNEALQLLDHTLEEVRETAHRLMPELLLRHGLVEAVRIFCANVEKAGKLKIEYQYFGYIGQLDGNLELIIYRVIQELIQNIVKHAAASFAVVQLSRHDNLLSITVEDNGKGMDVHAAGESGLGLQSIQHTIARLGGHCQIRSEKNNGTTVYIECNLQNTGNHEN